MSLRIPLAPGRRYMEGRHEKLPADISDGSYYRVTVRDVGGKNASHLGASQLLALGKRGNQEENQVGVGGARERGRDRNKRKLLVIKYDEY